MRTLLTIIVFLITMTLSAKSIGTLEEVTENSTKTTQIHTTKDGKKYTIYKGSRGGKFVIKVITRGANKGKYRREYVK